MKKEELNFYDVKSRQKFKSSDYRIEQRGTRFFAVTKSLVGTHDCWRVLSAVDAKRLQD